MTAVAVITLPGFNEIDSFLAFHILNRAEGVTAFLAGPGREAVSMNGVAVAVEGSLGDAARAEAVVVGSGRQTRAFAADPAFLASLTPDPSRQLIASQCSGALILAKKGLLEGRPVCTDDKTRPWIEDLGLEVVTQSLTVSGRIATAGGCLSAQVLATWLLLRLAGESETRRALATVAPVGEAAGYIDRLIAQARAADPQGLRETVAAEG
jgi:putative intracellular protease/amidase